MAVSKFQSKEAILEAYAAGQRVFGENYVQVITMCRYLCLSALCRLIPAGVTTGHELPRYQATVAVVLDPLVPPTIRDAARGVRRHKSGDPRR